MKSIRIFFINIKIAYYYWHMKRISKPLIPIIISNLNKSDRYYSLGDIEFSNKILKKIEYWDKKKRKKETLKNILDEKMR